MLLGSSTSLLVGWLAFATAVRGLAIPGYPFHSPFGSSGASKHALITKCKKVGQVRFRLIIVVRARSLTCTSNLPSSQTRPFNRFVRSRVTPLHRSVKTLPILSDSGTSGSIFLVFHRNPTYQPKQFAMKFDDGPDHPGDVIADLFTQHGVKTTFFVISSRNTASRQRSLYNWGCIYDFADEIIRRHKAGHIIASHTWSHVDITKMAPDALAQQLDLVDEALWKIIGVKPKFFRPPYGKHNAASIKAVKARNMTTIMWSFSSEDTVGKTPEQSLKEYGSLMKHFPAPEIALNHEIKEGTAQTVVPHILPRLIAKGYKLVTVDECLGVEPYREVGTPTRGAGCDMDLLDLAASVGPSVLAEGDDPNLVSAEEGTVGINDDPENDQQKKKNGWTRSRTWVASINWKSFDH
ncbi:BQ5605_C017g08524 [Microbotryum silenes-dioicae]|uniref:BQ5605_C017g08524 protein n=1 Tax=Microbotryum silenes-dioicae TaxID=796604 RepID=A0A2X0LZK8_9BASI|nr:BQ5605_C017g08524 [Microbotryum silenes-dioicae]